LPRRLGAVMLRREPVHGRRVYMRVVGVRGDRWFCVETDYGHGQVHGHGQGGESRIGFVAAFAVPVTAAAPMEGHVSGD
jgi:hypothetical protein